MLRKLYGYFYEFNIAIVALKFGTKDVEAIHGLIPGAKNNGSGWRVPCNLTTSIEFTIGGQAFPIDPRDIAFYPVTEDPGYCMSGIAVGGVGPFFLNTEWLVSC